MEVTTPMTQKTDLITALALATRVTTLITTGTGAAQEFAMEMTARNHYASGRAWESVGCQQPHRP